MTEIELLATHVGQPQVIGQLPHRAGARWSSIDRQPVEASELYLTWLGLTGDLCTESEPKPDGSGFIHGGNDKAVYAYPVEHYVPWIAELGEDGLADRSFGENWVLRGVLEHQVHIGDVWTLGDAELVVSKVRTPCATLAAYFGGQQMVKRMTQNGRCGWYLQVTRPGLVPSSGTITVVSQNLSGPTVAARFAEKMSNSADT